MESSDCIMPSSRKEAPINRVLMCSLFLQFWITNLKRRRSPPSQNLRASVVRSAAGRPARKTNGSASAVIRGTPSRREAFAPSAYTSGAKRNVSRAADGRRIRSGMPIRKNDDVSNKCGEALLESFAGSTAMPFIDTSALEVIERLPGWYGRYFHSPSMTFAHYDFKRFFHDGMSGSASFQTVGKSSQAASTRDA